MDTWKEDYVSEVPYVQRFYPELTPQLMRFALRWKGIDAPVAPFRYCELGSGFGNSVNINAAANPESTFIGIDFLTEHTESAQSLADEAGTPNVSFYADSFEQFENRDEAPFDFICLHGVWSWVNAENRQRIVEIIRNRLNPGGIVYISFNCLPGWAPAMPLRDLLWFHQDTSDAPILEKIDSGLKFAADLYETQSGYFSENKGFERSLRAMKGENRSVLAHEYFNRNWTPMYFSQVAEQMTAANLTFAAPVSLIDQFDPLTISPAAQQQLAKTTDPTLRETVLDFLVNRRFRRDLFVRNPKQLDVGNFDHLMDERFALMIPRSDLKLKHNLARGEVQLDAQIHEPIADALASGPRTLHELLQQPALATLSRELVVQAVTIAVGIGYVQPALPEEGESGRKTSTDRYNRTVCERARKGGTNEVLPSPVTGGGVRINNFEAMYLAAENAGQDPVDATWETLQQQKRRMSREGIQLVSDTDNLTALRQEYEAFCQRKRPVLERLGLIPE